MKPGEEIQVFTDLRKKLNIDKKAQLVEVARVADVCAVMRRLLNEDASRRTPERESAYGHTLEKLGRELHKLAEIDQDLALLSMSPVHGASDYWPVANDLGDAMRIFYTRDEDE